MATLKLSALEQHLTRKHLAPAYLVYGPDSGKVGEIARQLIRQIAGSLDDPFTLARLEEDTFADDPRRLADEVFSRPMLGARKVIWVAAAAGAFARAYEQLGDLPADGNVIVAEAGNLPRSAMLRALFENSSKAQAIPCYEDSIRDLDQLIDETFAETQLNLTHEAKDALLSYLGENRVLSRSEIDKLILYCHGKDAVTLADVEAICSGKNLAEVSELIDSVFNGDLAAADELADRQLKSGMSGSRLLTVAALHLPLLQKLALDVEDGTSPAHAVKVARPPVFFTRHDSVTQQLKIWDAEALSSASQSLSRATEQTREFPALEDQIAHRSLLSLARLAAGRRFQMN
jgi:DNA polymerase-3 subunit delta